jgi:hypothetical protein
MSTEGAFADQSDPEGRLADTYTSVDSIVLETGHGLQLARNAVETKHPMAAQLMRLSGVGTERIALGSARPRLQWAVRAFRQRFSRRPYLAPVPLPDGLESLSRYAMASLGTQNVSSKSWAFIQ